MTIPDFLLLTVVGSTDALSAIGFGKPKMQAPAPAVVAVRLIRGVEAVAGDGPARSSVVVEGTPSLLLVAETVEQLASALRARRPSPRAKDADLE